MSEAVETALAEALAVAARRREVRARLREALAAGDEAAVVRLARELLGEDDAEGDRPAARLNGAPG